MPSLSLPHVPTSSSAAGESLLWLLVEGMKVKRRLSIYINRCEASFISSSVKNLSSHFSPKLVWSGKRNGQERL